MSQPPQYSQGSADMALKVRDVLSQNYNFYEVSRLAPTNRYHAECGSLAMNILCGCFAQYYAYDVEILPQGVIVRSTVPCNGWWGGAIGAGKNADENRRVEHALQQAFQAGIIGYETAPPSSGPAAGYMSRPPAQAVTSSTSGPYGGAPPPLTTPSAAGSTTITKTTQADGSVTVTKETIHPNGAKTVEITTSKPATAEGEGKVPSTHSSSVPMQATIYQPEPEVTSYRRSAPVVIQKEMEQLPGPPRQIITSSSTTSGPPVGAPPPSATTSASGSTTITKTTHADGSLTVTKETFHPDGTKTVETTTSKRASNEGEEKVLASHNNNTPTQPEVTTYRANAPVVMQKETEQLPDSAQHYVVSSSSTTPALPTPSAAGSTTITKTTNADGSLTVTKETFHPNGTKTVEITTTKLASSREKEKVPSTQQNSQTVEAPPPQSEPEVTTDDTNTSEAKQEAESDQQSDPGDPTDGAASSTTSTAASTSVAKTTHADDSPADTAEKETFDANETETIEITTKKHASGDEEVQVVPVIHTMPMMAEPELSTAEYWTAQPVAMRQEVQPQLKTVLPPSGGTTTTTTTTTTEIASNGLVTVRKESLNQNGARVIKTTTYANVNAAVAAGVVL